MIELIIIAVLVFLLIATNVIWFVSWEKVTQDGLSKI